jgi:hypothetical protein
MTAQQIQQIGEKIGLEQAIDRDGLYWVLAAAREICFGKAEHLEANWQDKESARQWERSAMAIDKALGAIGKLDLPRNGKLTI